MAVIDARDEFTEMLHTRRGESEAELVSALRGSSRSMRRTLAVPILSGQQRAMPLDWTEIDRCMPGIYVPAEDEPAWPPLVRFKAVVLAIWRDLSDVELVEALEDRASF